MQTVVAAIVPSEVQVYGRLYLVAKPTVADALTILASCEVIAEGDPEAFTEIRRVCKKWLPRDLFRYLFPEPTFFNRWFAELLPLQEVMRIVTSLLSPRISDEHKEDETEVLEAAEKIGWSKVISTYASEYHMSPGAVLTSEWPLFTLCSKEIVRLIANRQMSNIGWYAGVRAGKIDDIKFRAYGERSVPVFIDKPKEWYDRQYEAIRVLKAKEKERAEAKRNATIKATNNC